MPPHLLHVVGARPNFPKLAPVHRACHAAGFRQSIVHTGQHYDTALSGSFFTDLGIPEPDSNLEVGSGSHAVQTARIMERFEQTVLMTHPDWIVVYGDVNSTLAAAVVASKLGVRIVHVEAGLRSFDRSMPEEINRIVTDRLADLLLTPSREADVQLLREGEAQEKIVFVGNVMIDSLMHALPRAALTGFAPSLGLAAGSYVLVTLHRPSNVDDPDRLNVLMDALDEIARTHPVVFPIHPRTRRNLDALRRSSGGVQLIEPVAYHEMIDLERLAFAAVTDSGGVQEETTALGVPCFTVRDNTERPATITDGTNQLVLDPACLPALLGTATKSRTSRRPEGWDGHAGERVASALLARS